MAQELRVVRYVGPNGWMAEVHGIVIEEQGDRVRAMIPAAYSRGWTLFDFRRDDLVDVNLPPPHNWSGISPRRSTARPSEAAVLRKLRIRREPKSAVKPHLPTAVDGDTCFRKQVLS